MTKKKQVLEPQAPELIESKEGMPKLVAPKRVMVPNPNLFQIYANGFQIAVGPLDVRLILIETVPLSPSEVQDRQIAAVILTPETLKLLADNIPRYVEQYEKKFGTIRDVKFAITSPDSAENKG